VVQAGAAADHLPAVGVGVVGEPKPGLDHLLVRGESAVGRERASDGVAGGVEPRAGLANERPEEYRTGRRQRIGLDLRFPAKAIVERQLRARLPAVLDIERELGLRDL